VTGSNRRSVRICKLSHGKRKRLFVSTPVEIPAQQRLVRRDIQPFSRCVAHRSFLAIPCSAAETRGRFFEVRSLATDATSTRVKRFIDRGWLAAIYV
jgi:hypothetical protein